MLGLGFCGGHSLVAASGGQSSSQCADLSLSRPLLLRSTGSRRAGSVVWLTGLVAPRHVGSSQTRARTRVPCIGRQILNHCATWEAPFPYFIKKKQKRKQKPSCVLVAYHHDYGDFFLHLFPHSPVIQSDLSATDNLLPSDPNLQLHQLQLTLSYSHNIHNISNYMMVLLLMTSMVN